MLSGARSGARHRLATDFATLGRHPTSDLLFDRERDLDVSARHAAVFRQGPTYVIRDLGSTNGTWVNGSRIRGDQALEPGDRIRLGSRGPEVEFAIVEADEATSPPRPVAEPPRPAPAPVEAPQPVRKPVPPPRPPAPPADGLQLRRELARRTELLRTRLLIGVVAIVVIGAGAAAWLFGSGEQNDQGVERERERLLAQVDSLQRQLAAASGQATELRAALDSARSETSTLRGAIASGGAGAEGLPGLDSAVEAALSRNTALLRAVGFDVQAIDERQGPSTGLVFVEQGDGRAVSATGFVARTRGDTAWVVTARHVVLGPGGGDPRRIGVALARRAGVYRGVLLAVHDSLDVAVLRVQSRIAFPTVTGLAPQLPRPGEPVAVIGFPLGLDLPMPADWTRTGALPTTTVATVSRVLPDLIQLDGYGVDGVSGSPVFNAAGEVIAMLYGGEPDTGGRIVYAVPAAGILDLLDRVAPVR